MASLWGGTAEQQQRGMFLLNHTGTTPGPHKQRDNGFFLLWEQPVVPARGRRSVQGQHSWHRGCCVHGCRHESGAPHQPQLPLELLRGSAGRKRHSTAPNLAQELCWNTAPQGRGSSWHRGELEEKENHGMLGSHSPQHLKAWPDTEQPPMDMGLIQDPPQSSCSPTRA